MKKIFARIDASGISLKAFSVMTLFSGIAAQEPKTGNSGVTQKPYVTPQVSTETARKTPTSQNVGSDSVGYGGVGSDGVGFGQAKALPEPKPVPPTTTPDLIPESAVTVQSKSSSAAENMPLPTAPSPTGPSLTEPSATKQSRPEPSLTELPSTQKSPTQPARPVSSPTKPAMFKQTKPQQTLPEQASPGQASPEQASPEQASPEQELPKQASPEQALPEPAAGKPLPTESSSTELIVDEAPPAAPVQQEPGAEPVTAINPEPEMSGTMQPEEPAAQAGVETDAGEAVSPGATTPEETSETAPALPATPEDRPEPQKSEEMQPAQVIEEPEAPEEMIISEPVEVDFELGTRPEILPVDIKESDNSDEGDASVLPDDTLDEQETF